MRRVMRGGAVLAIVALASGCSSIRLVSDYDEVIDKGTMDFAEQLNTHVKNMADLGGRPEGTYQTNFRTYNALDAKLDVLIARASSASSGLGCRLEKKVYDRVAALLQNQMPPEVRASDAGAAGDANGCNERLLILVKQQLGSIRTIHRETDKCGVMSCLRPATAKTAMDIANQSIRAVSVVENAKKQ